MPYISAWIASILADNRFSNLNAYRYIWPALMLGIFSGEFAKRQQMIFFAKS
jgi:hypothetical protein